MGVPLSPAGLGWIPMGMQILEQIPHFSSDIMEQNSS